MTTNIAPDPIFTELDFQRITGLNDGHIPLELKHLISDAEILSSYSIPETVVTMNTKLILRNTDDGNTQTVTLCYPHNADPNQGMFSVLSPIGMSMIGRRTGDCIHWKTPGGNSHSMVIEKILYQPEASGDYLV